MTWAWAAHRSYLLALTDGLIETPQRGACAEPAREIGVEQAMANHLHYYLTGRHFEPAVRERLLRNGYIWDRADAWVAGASGWLTHAPEPVRTIAEGQEDPRYRVVIAGFYAGLDDERPFFGDLALWLREAGMVRKQAHPDTSAFRATAVPILMSMHQCRRRARAPPTRILEDLGFRPLHYAGS